ncbi:MAG: hypothetical protein COV31_00410 [Candidatus Yanofskybacteria bacterium CG10_big_fil_rev_8_21_14_0_10_46_23]|uniref:Uncharacterized protein n=1 Tax=Candidatus Yanofskybacteria bacterium CG10_big_fil_rev_8_21_14_0_10_46_23 TaxID=1975098 RepID=A0A2H0R4V5_9BACT|nr:MAG: hypothetical protein COV31_00410 [Candidatus Yanofskybacteria bacterium CG10_big_fil_rev_8_21_14_0_10_46_23]
MIFNLPIDITPLLELNYLALSVGVIVAFYIIQVFIIEYHLIRFGIGSHPKLFALVFFIGAILIFGANVAGFYNLDPKEIFIGFQKLISEIDFRIPEANIP